MISIVIIWYAARYGTISDIELDHTWVLLATWVYVRPSIRPPVRPPACSPVRLFARLPVRPSACSPVRPSIDRRPATHQRAATTWRPLVVLNCYRYRLFVSVCVFLRSTRQLGESISVLHVIVCIGFCSFAAICYFLYITLLEL